MYKKTTLISLLLLCAALDTMAQSIRITPYRAPTALYFDAFRLFNYNRYEQGRIEVGLRWVIPNEAYSPHPARYLWTLNGYAAYGTRNREFAFGGGVQVRLPGTHGIRLRLSGIKDLELAASRRLGDYRMLNFSNNTGYVTSRYSAVRGIQLQGYWTIAPGWDAAVTIRQSLEEYRFDDTGRLFPAIDPSEVSPTRHFGESTLRFDYRKRLTLCWRGGRHQMADCPANFYMQALVQYDNTFFDRSLELFVQAGYATPGTPFSRLFDLSGTDHGFYFFRNSFLTVASNSLTSHLFVHTCLHYTLPHPLWQRSWTRPQPFAQINAQWGILADADNHGQTVCDGLSLQAPYMGVFEPAIGIDGLIRWQLIDLGFGMAYQLTPTAAPYHHSDFVHNFAILLIANLIIDQPLR